MKQRFCRLTLYNTKTKSKKVFTDLAITFEITTVASTDYAKGIVKVAGLSTDTIKEYTMFTPNWLADGYFKELTLEAGYIMDDAQHTIKSSTLFSGYIIKAIPTQLPERWMTFELIESLNSSFENISLKYNNISFYNLVTEVGKAFGLLNKEGVNVVMDYTGRASSFILDDYNMQGNLQQHLEKIKFLCYKEGGFRVWYNNGMFYIGDYAAKEGSSSDIKIGGKDGLIIFGVPKPDWAGCTVKTEISDTLKLFTRFKLESTQIPSLNGTYNPIMIHYVGENRGTDWYAEITAIAIERAAEKVESANG